MNPDSRSHSGAGRRSCRCRRTPRDRRTARQWVGSTSTPGRRRCDEVLQLSGDQGNVEARGERVTAAQGQRAGPGAQGQPAGGRVLVAAWRTADRWRRRRSRRVGGSPGRPLRPAAVEAVGSGTSSAGMVPPPSSCGQPSARPLDLLDARSRGRGRTAVAAPGVSRTGGRDTISRSGCRPACRGRPSVAGGRIEQVRTQVVVVVASVVRAPVAGEDRVDRTGFVGSGDVPSTGDRHSVPEAGAALGGDQVVPVVLAVQRSAPPGSPGPWPRGGSAGPARSPGAVRRRIPRARSRPGCS